MARKVIDVVTPRPTEPGKPQRAGESPKSAFQKINDMTQELYERSGGTGSLPAGSKALINTSNLADLPDKVEARSNLGLGSAAVADVVGLVANGAVIERGSNANGGYTKFADGTMICTGSGILGWSGYVSYLVCVITFPVSFFAPPIATSSYLTTREVTGVPRGQRSGPDWDHVSINGGAFYLWRTTGGFVETDKMNTTWIAIGRWK